jgi:hypothetical protein
MDYTRMSLVELKQAAKGRRIKLYYIMKRHDLIRLLSLPELPASYRLEKLTIHELREEARQKGIRGFWTLHREDLLSLLYPSYQNGNSNQHEDPQDPNSNDVGGEGLPNHTQQGRQKRFVKCRLDLGALDTLEGVGGEGLHEFAH